jgi:predicted secreted Zn-dependent protease
MKFVSTVAAATLLVSAIFPANAASLHRKYAYFTIHGNTAADLDRELQRRGPFLESDREHHAGAATMHFDTTVKYGLTSKTCRIVKADVTLRVTITLPRWNASRPPDDPYLAIVWDVLSHDIKRHEEEHVRIAHGYAGQLEQALRHLRPTKGCEAMKQEVQKTTHAVLARNDRAQHTFDRREQANFRSRFRHLLDKRLKSLSR